MFVPVACLKCGKPFQVPEAAAGTEVACPWCKGTTPALPVAGLTPPSLATAVAPTPAAAEPLSLDELPPEPAPSHPRKRVPILSLFVGGLLLGLGSLATFAVLRQGTGWVPSFAWQPFEPPGREFRVEMPGHPTGEALDPIPDFLMTRPGQRFTARHWYAKTLAAVGWVDIDPERAKDMRVEDLAEGESGRRRQQLAVTAWDRRLANRNGRDGMEYTYDTPTGRVVDRMILVREGPTPRLYILTYGAPRLTGVEERNVMRFFDSFQPQK